MPLQLFRRFSFLWHYPHAHAHWELPSNQPYGARTFLIFAEQRRDSLRYSKIIIAGCEACQDALAALVVNVRQDRSCVNWIILEILMKRQLAWLGGFLSLRLFVSQR